MTQNDILTQRQAETLAVIDGNAKLAESTRRQYGKALQRFWQATGASITDTTALTEHAQGLSASSRSFLKAAIRKVTENAARDIKSNVTPETVNAATAALMRLEAIQDTIEVTTPKGQKAHVWLNQAQVRQLFAACGGDIVGRRDKIIIGLLVAAGLRREEAAGLRFEDIIEQPTKNGTLRTVLSVKGKGDKVRAVPISKGFAVALEAWRAVCGGSGYVARSLGMGRRLGDSISCASIFDIVRKRGRLIGFDLAAHDLRRTYAQLGFSAGVPITQISVLLGHKDVATTQRYLNLKLDLEVTASDFVPFNGEVA